MALGCWGWGLSKEEAMLSGKGMSHCSCPWPGHSMADLRRGGTAGRGEMRRLGKDLAALRERAKLEPGKTASDDRDREQASPGAAGDAPGGRDGHTCHLLSSAAGVHACPGCPGVTAFLQAGTQAPESLQAPAPLSSPPHHHRSPPSQSIVAFWGKDGWL